MAEMFEHLVGNENIKTILQRLVADSRVPNSMLFAGPEGIGKRQFAIGVAKAIVCQTKDACGSCPACMRAGAFFLPTSDKKEDWERVFLSEHPDVGVIVPFKRNLLVGSIRELEREASFRPYEASARLFIIDDAHKMNDAASNALLKTLEEPASTTHLILITSSPDSLLQTILSRCQVFRFEPIAKDLIRNALLKTEKFDADDDADLAASVSRGSLGRALEIDPGKYRLLRRSMLDTVSIAAGHGGRERLFALSEELTGPNNKDDYDESLSVLQDVIHDAWLAANGADPVDFRNADIANEIRNLGENIPATRFAAWMKEIELLRENLIVN
ncbi:MAG TPA: DNA polymerase III subunit, partial [Pyrinomonadaceae bacterium]|nr:DNA polymerase III subunit [Pyrinomonadaceae bacterium]